VSWWPSLDDTRKKTILFPAEATPTPKGTTSSARRVPLTAELLSVLNRLRDALKKGGYGDINSRVAEKLFRVVHCIALLIALLGHPGQKIFWMTDHDPIGETPQRHTKLLDILSKVLPLYTTKSFSFLGGACPFTPRAFDLLDLLSVSDIAAGAIAQCLSSLYIVGQQNAQMKPGGDHVLRWLCHNSVTLKKFAMTVKRLPNGVPALGPIDFEARVPMKDELFIPTQLVL
jgi:hypothetical protein